MEEDDTSSEPSWDSALTLALTPSAIMNTVFLSADSVHTGWQSCIDEALVTTGTTVVDEQTANHCRLAEQEYVDRDAPEETWHDWTVELRLGEVFVSGHWRERVGGSPADWQWCSSEAEQAFMTACVLIGKRVRRGFVVDPSPDAPRASRTRH